MILYWLQKFFAFLRWLFVAPNPRDVAHIDPDAKCPACGGKDGKLETVIVGPQSSGEKNSPPAKIQVRHTCNICGAIWGEKPILDVDSTKVQAMKRAAAA